MTSCEFNFVVKFKNPFITKHHPLQDWSLFFCFFVFLFFVLLSLSFWRVHETFRITERVGDTYTLINKNEPFFESFRRSGLRRSGISKWPKDDLGIPCVV